MEQFYDEFRLKLPNDRRRTHTPAQKIHSEWKNSKFRITYFTIPRPAK